MQETANFRIKCKQCGNFLKQRAQMQRTVQNAKLREKRSLTTRLG